MSAVIGMELPRGSACFYFYNPLEYIQREAAVNATAVESSTEQATHDLVSYINEQMAASLNRISSETQVARDAANENLNKIRQLWLEIDEGIEQLRRVMAKMDQLQMDKLSRAQTRKVRRRIRILRLAKRRSSRSNSC